MILIYLIGIIEIMCCSLTIKQTNNSLGYLVLSETKHSCLYIISFQDNVTLQIKKNNFKMFDYIHNRKWFVLKPSGPTIHLKYFKTLSKSFSYDYNLDIGTKIFVLEYEKGELINYKEVYDCCAIPDLSMAFISYTLCGILLSFVFKVYLKY